MAMTILDAGASRTITTGWVRQAGVLRRLQKVQVMDGGTLRTVATFAPPLSASASPGSVSGTSSGSGPTDTTTSATTASPTGGLGPYTYSWTRISGEPTAAVNSPTMATTTFTATITPGTQVATFEVTITDAFGQTDTATVTAIFENDVTGTGF